MKQVLVPLLILFMLFSTSSSALTITSTFTPLAGANNSPVQTNHVLWDGNHEYALNASDVAVNLVSINFTITDADGHNMNWTLYQGTNLIDSDTTTGNGTKITTNTSWIKQKTNYTLYFNVTDGVDWNNKTLWFTTNYSIPVFSGENPGNGSTITSSSTTWSITITDEVPFNYSISCSNNQSINGTRNTTGTYSLPLSGLSEYTEYIVWVNVTNGNNTIHRWYVFNTLSFGSGSTPRRPGGGGAGLLIPPTEDTLPSGTSSKDTGGSGMTMYTGLLILVVVIFLFIFLYLKRRKKT